VKVKITALSPMHFAASPFYLTPLDYAFLNNRCYILSEDRLLRALADKGAIGEFMEWMQKAQEPPKQPKEKERDRDDDAMRPWSMDQRAEPPWAKRSKPQPRQREQRRHQPEITSFLRRKGLLKEAELLPMTRYTVPCRVPPDDEVRSLPRAIDGSPYLPATAVKGALRIAVAHKLLKEMPEKARQRLLDYFVADELDRFRRDDRGGPSSTWFRERFKQTLARRFDYELFQKFRLGDGGGRYGPNTDLFRAIRVADSKPIDQGAVSICNVRVHSAHARTSPKPWTIFAECVWIGTTFEADVQIDDRLIDAFAKANDGTPYGLPFSTVADTIRNPLGATAEMASALFAEEERFLDQELEMPGALDLRGEEPNLRLGWGTSMLGTSVSLLLPARLRTELRNLLFRNAGDNYAPKSRKLVEMGGNSFSMGWARVVRNA